MENTLIWNSLAEKWSSSVCLCFCLACMLINAFFSKNHPYVFPKSPEAVTTHVSSEPTPSDYPTTLPGRAFKSNEVMNLSRVSLQMTERIQYQCRPELLQRETFVSFNEDEVFRILVFITAGQERIFYVVNADEGPEAVACTSIDLFDLLCTSEQILIQNFKDSSIPIDCSFLETSRAIKSTF